MDVRRRRVVHTRAVRGVEQVSRIAGAAVGPAGASEMRYDGAVQFP